MFGDKGGSVSPIPFWGQLTKLACANACSHKLWKPPQRGSPGWMIYDNPGFRPLTGLWMGRDLGQRRPTTSAGRLDTAHYSERSVATGPNHTPIATFSPDYCSKRLL
jgi:hypothetical protein